MKKHNVIDLVLRANQMLRDGQIDIKHTQTLYNICNKEAELYDLGRLDLKYLNGKFDFDDLAG